MICLSGIALIKRGEVVAGALAIGTGLLIEWVIDLIPYPNKKKYKLPDKVIDELKVEVTKDSVERKLAYLENEKTRELIEFVDALSFEDALIVLTAIEEKHPTLITGKREV